MGFRQLKFDDYEGFCEKFKPKKTTDDCYTPENIYNCVLDWCVRRYGISGAEIVRPFWPGGDYESFDYPSGCVVIDNPPFSIISKIVRFYHANRIDYFLFAPYLTNLSIGAGCAGVNHVVAPCTVRYENGAGIATSFVTNLGDDFILSAPDLMDAIRKANDANLKAGKKSLQKYVYPDCVVTSTSFGYLCHHHTQFALKRSECAFIRRLDAQGDKSIFGGGYIISERAAAERAAATFWELSPREREIQRMLSHRGECLTQ